MYELYVPALISSFDEVSEFVHASLADAPTKAVRKLLIACDEIFTNIASYAYAPEQGDVRIRIMSEPGSATVEFEDGGIAYNPLDQEDPDITLVDEDRDEGGLGVYMVKNLMDKIEYRYEDGKNFLAITILYD